MVFKSFKAYKNKPTSYEIGIEQNNLKNGLVTPIYDLQGLYSGIVDNRIIFNANEEYLILDIDKSNIDFNFSYNKLKQNNLTPNIAYKTASYGVDNTYSYRFIYKQQKGLSMTSKMLYTSKFELLLNVTIDRCFSRNTKQVMYGTHKGVVLLSIVDVDLLANKFLNDNTLFEEHKLHINSNISNYTTNNKNTKQLEELYNIKDYTKQLKYINDLIRNNTHISYELALRLCFANYYNKVMINKVLSLTSKDTQNSVLKLLETKNSSYLLNLVKDKENNVFVKISKYNYKNKNKFVMEL